MRHVIWDWNGTLADDLPAVVDCVNASLAAIGAGPIAADDYRDHYTRPVRRFYDRLLGRLVSDDEWATIDRVFHEEYAVAARDVPLALDAKAAIAAVAAAGGTQSILSMWWHEHLLPEVERHDLGRFMVRVDGNTKDAGETKARLLQLHVRELDTSDEPVMVGDALDDVVAAREVGIRCVLYDGGSHHRAELEAARVPVTKSLLAAVAVALGSQ